MRGNDVDSNSAGALKGLRVIDLSRVLSGPYCTQMLADHGAEVIKVEPPDGDQTREWGPPAREGDHASSFFLGLNRNKKGISLDLSSNSGKAVLFKLLESADILVENFLPGTMEKWGLGYEEVLKARYPRLIYCRISGFGNNGPYAGFPGYDAVIQAMSGIMSLNGQPDGEPVRAAVPVVDMASASNACIGILMAVLERTNSGMGQLVDITLYESAISLLYPYVTNLLNAGEKPRRVGNGHPSICPYGKFETLNGAIFIGIGNDSQFVKLCREIGRPALADIPECASNMKRLENRDWLENELAVAFKALDGFALSNRLLAQGVPCGPVMSVFEVLNHDHTKYRGVVVSHGDEYRGVANPVRLGRTPARVRSAPPTLAENSVEVLASLGLVSNQTVSGERITI